jgi:hypothetical protein
MSERERWIVYPLLFLALGVGLRDELFNRTWSKNVVCQQLVMVEEDPVNFQHGPEPIAAIGPQGGTIDEVSQNGLLRVDTVWARNVVADNFTSRDSRMNIIPYLLQLLGTSRAPAASPRREVGPRPPAIENGPGNSTDLNQDAPENDKAPAR